MSATVKDDTAYLVGADPAGIKIARVPLTSISDRSKVRPHDSIFNSTNTPKYTFWTGSAWSMRRYSSA